MPGQGFGRGRRQGGGTGRGQGRVRGVGRGLKGGMRMGPEGFCICPKCGHRGVHRPGAPCLEERCPSCGSAMIREGSAHHREIENRRPDGPTES